MTQYQEHRSHLLFSSIGSSDHQGYFYRKLQNCDAGQDSDQIWAQVNQYNISSSGCPSSNNKYITKALPPVGAGENYLLPVFLPREKSSRHEEAVQTPEVQLTKGCEAREEGQ